LESSSESFHGFSLTSSHSEKHKEKLDPGRIIGFSDPPATSGEDLFTVINLKDILDGDMPDLDGRLTKNMRMETRNIKLTSGIYSIRVFARVEKGLCSLFSDLSELFLYHFKFAEVTFEDAVSCAAKVQSKYINLKSDSVNNEVAYSRAVMAFPESVYYAHSYPDRTAEPKETYEITLQVIL
jgi:uncharacterized protein YqkB